MYLLQFPMPLMMAWPNLKNILTCGLSLRILMTSMKEPDHPRFYIYTEKFSKCEVSWMSPWFIQSGMICNPEIREQMVGNCDHILFGLKSLFPSLQKPAGLCGLPIFL